MPHPNYLTALDMLEYCRFIYRAYAQTCLFPMDPFFESHGEGLWQGARDRLMETIHKGRKSTKEVTRLDPIEYDLDHAPDPRNGVVYRGGTGEDPFILFQPRRLDKAIAVAQGTSLTGEDTNCIVTGASGSKRCCHFQGMTGMTRSHPRDGWPSWLGACIYDSRDRTMVVVFRGSRSGSGGRALAQAELESVGNPDWVTDMNHLKGVAVSRLGDAVLACGFWYAYESCRTSLEAAFYEALHHGELEKVFFTGHSLGGALAQCAHVDMVGGTLLEDGKAMSARKKKLERHCYAISAPPICLGKESAATVGKLCGENIYHYFAAKDSVHDSPEVTLSAASLASSMTTTLSHPLAGATHVGTHIKLPCVEPFPLAHEPFVVRKGIVNALARETNMNLGADPGFWPLFRLDPLVTSGSPVTDVPFGFDDEVRAAMNPSTSKNAASNRADLWSAVAVGFKTKQGYEKIGYMEGEAFDVFNEACKLLHDLNNPFGCVDLVGKTRTVKALRKQLVHQYRGAKDHKATSASLWTMLQYLSVRQYEWKLLS
jgi:hypothetical protein